MNKMAMPDCHNCRGTGKIQVPISLKMSREAIVEPPEGQTKAQGFAWVNCGGCGGRGRR
jgi:hypothetical protein